MEATRDLQKLESWAIVDNNGLFNIPEIVPSEHAELSLVGKITKKIGEIETVNTIFVKVMRVDNCRAVTTFDNRRYAIGSAMEEYKRFVLNRGIDIRKGIRCVDEKSLHIERLKEMVEWHGVDFTLDDITVEAIEDLELKQQFMIASHAIARIYSLLDLERE